MVRLQCSLAPEVRRSLVHYAEQLSRRWMAFASHLAICSPIVQCSNKLPIINSFCDYGIQRGVYLRQNVEQSDKRFRF